MGKEKAGFLTPKAISNRIKAKGLQKLRWYCQMCQKQCRDENGFKCHLMSESHQRQLLLFAENPDTYLDAFSEEFESTFLELLSRRFGTKRVRANQVYQEYISDRDHTHMNSTQWETLTDFVKWLGREGKCVVDHTEKGWFITYVDRDPEAIRRQEQAQTKAKMDLDDEEQNARFIQRQIERAEMNDADKSTPEFTELQRENEEEKVTFSLTATEKKHESKTKILPSANALSKSIGKTDQATSSTKPKTEKVMPGQKRKSALDEIMEMEEKKREKVNRKENWICKDIVVKIVTKKLGDKFHKKKGVIMDVIDDFGAVVKLLTGEDKIKLDQSHLETVIPAEGKTVKVVNGAYRGEEAVLVTLNAQKFSCTLKISRGPLKGRVVEGVEYEDISKLHQPS